MPIRPRVPRWLLALSPSLYNLMTSPSPVAYPRNHLEPSEPQELRVLCISPSERLERAPWGRSAAMTGKTLLPGLTPTPATRSTVEIQISCAGRAIWAPRQWRCHGLLGLGCWRRVEEDDTGALDLRMNGSARMGCGPCDRDWTTAIKPSRTGSGSRWGRWI